MPFISLHLKIVIFNEVQLISLLGIGQIVFHQLLWVRRAKLPKPTIEQSILSPTPNQLTSILYFKNMPRFQGPKLRWGWHPATSSIKFGKQVEY